MTGERTEDDGGRHYQRIQAVRDCLSRYAESVGNFYSPLESPAGNC